VTVTRPIVTVVAKARDRGGRLGSLEIFLAGGQSEIIKGAEQAADAEPTPQDEEKETQLLLAQLEAKLLEYRQDDDRLVFQASQGMRWGDSMLAVDSCRQTTQLARLQKEGKLKTYFPDLKLNGRTKLFTKIEMDLIRANQ
jgi:hypothetical protein